MHVLSLGNAVAPPKHARQLQRRAAASTACQVVKSGGPACLGTKHPKAQQAQHTLHTAAHSRIVCRAAAASTGSGEAHGTQQLLSAYSASASSACVTVNGIEYLPMPEAVELLRTSAMAAAAAREGADAAEARVTELSDKLQGFTAAKIRDEDTMMAAQTQSRKNFAAWKEVQQQNEALNRAITAAAAELEGVRTEFKNATAAAEQLLQSRVSAAVEQQYDDVMTNIDVQVRLLREYAQRVDQDTTVAQAVSDAEVQRVSQAARGTAESQALARATISQSASTSAEHVAQHAKDATELSTQQQQEILTMARAIQDTARESDVAARQHSMQAATLRAVVDELRSALQRAHATVRDARSHIASLNKEAAEHVSTVWKAAEEKVSEAEAAYEVAKEAERQRTLTANADAARYSRRLEALVQSNAELLTQLTSAQHAVAQATARASAASQQLPRQLQAAESNALALVDARIMALDVTMQQLRLQLQQQGHDRMLVTLNAARDSLHDAHAANASRIATLDRAIDAMARDCDGHASHAAALQRQLKEAQGQLIKVASDAMQQQQSEARAMTQQRLRASLLREFDVLCSRVAQQQDDSAQPSGTDSASSNGAVPYGSAQHADHTSNGVY